MEFYRDVEIAAKPVQFSSAAALTNRQDVFAGHNSLGEASIWVTVSPDDTKQLNVVWYALGREEATKYKDVVPSGNFRFNILSEHPVAAALQFARLYEMVMEYVVGWNMAAGKPYKRGGLFGIPKAWVRVVEEQARLTLHVHILIWLVGHSNLKSQLIPCNWLPSSVHLVPCNSNTPSVVIEEEMVRRELQERKKEEILLRLQANLECLIQSELRLPDEEMNVACRCQSQECDGELVVRGKDFLKKMRMKKKPADVEIDCLQCPLCEKKSTISSQLDVALVHGFNRCFGRSRLSSEEITTVIWKGLESEPSTEDTVAHDRWLLQVAAIHIEVNLHDWKHRESCFKGKKPECRYKIPKPPVQSTKVALVEKEDNTTQLKILTVSLWSTQ